MSTDPEFGSQMEGYINSFKEVKQVIDDFEVRTKSPFVLYSSNASFGTSGKNTFYDLNHVHVIFTIYFLADNFKHNYL